MKLNPKKCKELTVHFCRDIEHFPPDLAVTGNALETVEAHKVLGVTIQSNLKWDSHVNEIVGKASKGLHILRELKRSGAPPHDLLRVYIALIRSVGVLLPCVAFLSLCPALRKNRESAKTRVTHHLSCLSLRRRFEAVWLHDSMCTTRFLVCENL